jgi:hypothetical protein
MVVSKGEVFWPTIFFFFRYLFLYSIEVKINGVIIMRLFNLQI